MSQEQNSIYNLSFLLVCFSSFLFSASFNMLIPELPAYLTSLGGAQYKGLIIALFTITAGISRPFSGKLTDKIGRVPIMAIGSIVCFVCGFLYPILTSISGFLFLRLVHGFSTGFKPTAISAFVADTVPAGKWGEAMGVHGLFFSTGMAIGPAIGSEITRHFSINTLFYTSSMFALASILIIYKMKETLPQRQKFKFNLLKMKRSEWINKQAMPTFWVTFFSYISYGAIITVIPDWTTKIGISNKGIFFMIFTVSSLMVRFFAGKISDTYGRKPILKISLVVLSIALFWLGLWQTMAGFISGAVIYGIATGMLSPAISAWTIDLSDADKRGVSVATMYIALEAGIGIGAFFSGWFVKDIILRTPYVFYAISIANVIGIIYLFNHTKKDKKESPL